MEWKQLLSTKRVRSLLGEPPIRKPVPDFRREIEKDYGKAVFCTPVKRLQDKAQVFPLEPIDAVRTRLTHSLEVSSVAKSLCRFVAGTLSDLEPDSIYDIETIGATCGLLHDIGNPPFGHSGEDAIRAWFADRVPKPARPEDDIESMFGKAADADKRFQNDLLKYEGNAQTLRLISRLQVFSDRRGLNLTAAVFSAMSKYIADSTSIDKNIVQRKKLGHYNSEKHIVELVQAETGTGAARHPLSYLIEASDDICYLLGDLEDAVKKDVIRWSDAADVFRADEMGRNLIEATETFTKSRQGLHSGKALDQCSAQYFRVEAMRNFVTAVGQTFHRRYGDIMDGNYTNELVNDCNYGGLFGIIDRFSKERVYTSDETVRLEVLGYNIIRDLLQIFSKADANAKPNTLGGKLYQLISPNYRSVFEHQEKWEDGFPEEYRHSLLITDYICGMTDTFAVRLHSQLTQVA